jgi:hypothetical protein
LSPVSIQILTTDFTALNTTGSVNFINSNAPGNNIHGLADWISPSQTHILLPSAGSQTISVKIANISSLAPGGHYGALIFKVLSAPLSNKGNQLSTNTEVSTLVFLTTSSGAKKKISLYTPDISSFALKMPNSVNLVFKNTGNTQTTPRGIVTVNDKSNKEVGRGIINIDSGLVLPDTSRLYEINMKYENKILYPGTYHVNIYYRASDNASIFKYTKSFLYLNWTFILTAALFILFVTLLIFWLIRTTNNPKKRP